VKDSLIKFDIDYPLRDVKYNLKEILDGGPGRTRTSDQWIMSA